MTYFEQLRKITKNIPTSIIDFAIPRDRTSPPTQASSNFITNKEQGDWAEDLIFRAINETSENYIAVRYGKSDDLIAGDSGFDKFYTDFQDELDTIGKRPDLLVFKKTDFDTKLGFDISKIEHSLITDYVKKSIAGLEIRSSAYLVEEYNSFMNDKNNQLEAKILSVKDELISNHHKTLKQKDWFETIENINSSTIKNLPARRAPGWRKDEFKVSSDLIKEMNGLIKLYNTRDYLSITTKVEDLKVVHKWAESFNVPHYYFQVFFDSAFGISFKKILQIISKNENKGVFFSIEKDTKNQQKTTIKTNVNQGLLISKNIDKPSHKSCMKKLNRGSLLYFVSFEKGKTPSLIKENLKELLNITDF